MAEHAKGQEARKREWAEAPSEGRGHAIYCQGRLESGERCNTVIGHVDDQNPENNGRAAGASGRHCRACLSRVRSRGVRRSTEVRRRKRDARDAAIREWLREADPGDRERTVEAVARRFDCSTGTAASTLRRLTAEAWYVEREAKQHGENLRKLAKALGKTGGQMGQGATGGERRTTAKGMATGHLP